MNASNLVLKSQVNEIAFGNNCGYQIDGDSVYLNASEIFNSRDISNLSGTLSLELWALRHAYRGDDFDGYALAGAQICQISGQHFVSGVNIKTDFKDPPAGRWQLCLMLREWSGNHFTTRDYVNFNTPYQIGFNPIVHTSVDNIVSLKPVETHSSTPVLDIQKQASESISKESKTTKSDSAKKDDTLSDQKLISINKAKIDDFLKLPGMSTKLAAAIVAHRPYKKLEDLLSVKGVGAKTFEKIKDYLSL
jgi:competence ComEA-like helix-hairpin-helix protein